MKFTRHDRQRIIDEYLASTGRNMFVPGEFIDWLYAHPSHEAYDWFFAENDAAMARERRLDMARRMVSGLRVVSRSHQSEATVTAITVREYPAFVSPISGRKDGGGYVPFNPDDDEALQELLTQGAISLRSWMSRYRGAFERAGFSLDDMHLLVATALNQIPKKTA